MTVDTLASRAPFQLFLSPMYFTRLFLSLISLFFFPEEGQMLNFLLFQATEIKKKPKNGLSSRDIGVLDKKNVWA